jgi:hypothetical protein
MKEELLRQIRDALTHEPTVRIEHFRRDRIASIRRGEMPVPLTDHPKTALHLVPLEVLESDHGFAMDQLSGAQLLPLYAGGSRRPSFDGLLSFNEQSYALLFRNGAIEAVESSIMDDGYIPSVALQQALVDRLGDYLSILSRLGVAPPVLLMISLLGVADCRVTLSRRQYMRAMGSGEYSLTFGRDELLCPPVSIEEPDADPAEVLKPSLDIIANAAGLDEWDWNARR